MWPVSDELIIASRRKKCSHSHSPASSGVARSLVLGGHLLYASPLASRSCVLRARLCDMSGTNMVLWAGTCPARPALRYATACIARVMLSFQGDWTFLQLSDVWNLQWHDCMQQMWWLVPHEVGLCSNTQKTKFLLISRPRQPLPTELTVNITFICKVPKLPI